MQVNIKELCSTHGLCQRDLAAITGLREETISKFANNKLIPSERTVCRIYRAVGKKYVPEKSRTPLSLTSKSSTIILILISKYQKKYQ